MSKDFKNMNIFIAGPRAICSLNREIETRLSNIIKNGHSVLVGDANGADTCIQRFFAAQNYANITVYASMGKARNNIGDWYVKKIPVPAGAKGFDFYAAKDIAMADNADYGFMIWNGKSRGTLNNLLNLTSRGKPTLLFLTVFKEFHNIKTFKEVEHVAERCGGETVRLLASLSGPHTC
jgi:hypothetical protein